MKSIKNSRKKLNKFFPKKKFFPKIKFFHMLAQDNFLAFLN